MECKKCGGDGWIIRKVNGCDTAYRCECLTKEIERRKRGQWVFDVHKTENEQMAVTRKRGPEY